jgi:hypothetical protein
MTALGKLLRTTAFKLTLVYLTVFALFAVFLLAYFAWNTRRLITEQITQTVDAEITGLAEQYRQGGIRRLVFVVDARSRRPGSSLYLVTTRAGEGLAGNVGSLATGILETSGWTETAYRRLDDPDGARASRPGSGVSTVGRIPSPRRARSRGARTSARHRARRRPLVVGHRHRARRRRRLLRHATGSQAR